MKERKKRIASGRKKIRQIRRCEVGSEKRDKKYEEKNIPDL